MGKIAFAINITIDGFADHTAMIADEELHDFFTNYLKNIDIVLFGRKTYEMMAAYWPHADKDPKSKQSEIEFANVFNQIPKVVFSKTLSKVDWNNTELNKGDLIEEVKKLKEKDGKNISAGSLSIASQLLKQNLIDEFWFLIHPVILGKGVQLFENLNVKTHLKLLDTKVFGSGVIALHYEKNR
jgi:dihydrofolate reductase